MTTSKNHVHEKPVTVSSSMYVAASSVNTLPKTGEVFLVNDPVADAVIALYGNQDIDTYLQTFSEKELSFIVKNLENSKGAYPYKGELEGLSHKMYIDIINFFRERKPNVTEFYLARLRINKSLGEELDEWVIHFPEELLQGNAHKDFIKTLDEHVCIFDNRLRIKASPEDNLAILRAFYGQNTELAMSYINYYLSLQAIQERTSVHLDIAGNITKFNFMEAKECFRRSQRYIDDLLRRVLPEHIRKDFTSELLWGKGISVTSFNGRTPRVNNMGPTDTNLVLITSASESSAKHVEKNLSTFTKLLNLLKFNKKAVLTVVLLVVLILMSALVTYLADLFKQK